MQGIGFGLVIPVSFATFNQYFVQRRVFVMSLAQALTGILTMLYPIFVAYIRETFGFRGALALVAAINGHIICTMLVMQPVEKHMKVIKISIMETEEELCKMAIGF